MSRLSAKIKIRFKNFLARVAKKDKEQFGDERLRGYNLNKRVYRKEEDNFEESVS